MHVPLSRLLAMQMTDIYVSLQLLSDWPAFSPPPFKGIVVCSVSVYVEAPLCTNDPCRQQRAVLTDVLQPQGQPGGYRHVPTTNHVWWSGAQQTSSFLSARSGGCGGTECLVDMRGLVCCSSVHAFKSTEQQVLNDGWKHLLDLQRPWLLSLQQAPCCTDPPQHFFACAHSHNHRAV